MPCTEDHPCWVEDRLGVLYHDAVLVDPADLHCAAASNNTPESELLRAEQRHLAVRLAIEILRHDDAAAVLSIVHGDADSGAAAARAAGITEVRLHRAIRRLASAVAEA